jgi:hypothetical protein
MVIVMGNRNGKNDERQSNFILPVYSCLSSWIRTYFISKNSYRMGRRGHESRCFFNQVSALHFELLYAP